MASRTAKPPKTTAGRGRKRAPHGIQSKLRPAEVADLHLNVHRHIETCKLERGGDMTPTAEDMQMILQKRDTTTHHARPRPNPMDRMDPLYAVMPGGDTGAGANAACCSGLSAVSVVRPDYAQLGTRMWPEYTLGPWMDAMDALMAAYDDPACMDGSNAVDMVQSLRNPMGRSKVPTRPGRPLVP